MSLDPLENAVFRAASHMNNAPPSVCAIANSPRVLPLLVAAHLWGGCAPRRITPACVAARRDEHRRLKLRRLRRSSQFRVPLTLFRLSESQRLVLFFPLCVCGFFLRVSRVCCCASPSLDVVPYFSVPSLCVVWFFSSPPFSRFSSWAPLCCPLCGPCPLSPVPPPPSPLQNSDAEAALAAGPKVPWPLSSSGPVFCSTLRIVPRACLKRSCTWVAVARGNGLKQASERHMDTQCAVCRVWDEGPGRGSWTLVVRFPPWVFVFFFSLPPPQHRSSHSVFTQGCPTSATQCRQVRLC